MIESSKDILNILLGISSVWLVLWISYLLFQISKTLRLINKTVEGVEYAIESFNEELHNFICPSKPLKSLLLFLKNLEEENLQKLITIILGIGEKKEDLHRKN